MILLDLLMPKMGGVTAVRKIKGLTPREREVLAQIARGRSNQEIAACHSGRRWTMNGEEVIESLRDNTEGQRPENP